MTERMVAAPMKALSAGRGHLTVQSSLIRCDDDDDNLLVHGSGPRGARRDVFANRISRDRFTLGVLQQIIIDSFTKYLDEED